MEIKLNFEGFDGHIKMKVASNIDRLDMMDKIGINIMELRGSADNEKVFGKTSVIVRLLKASKKYYSEIALKKDGKEFSSFDDLDNDPSCQPVMMQCAMKALVGLGADEEKK